jgi:hypothetical protein
MAQFLFGAGLLFAQATTGGSVAFGTIQDISVDLENETKMLYGANDYPDIIANGKSKCSIKAKFGQISGSLFNATYYNAGIGQGLRLLVIAESQTITTNTVTVTNGSGATITANSVADMGVRYAFNGAALTQVQSAPVQGQYTYTAAGVYTFAAADNAAGVLITYTYRTNTAASGTTYIRNQQLMGTSIFFSLFLSQSLNGLQSNMNFFRVKSSKLSMQTKNDDFTIPEMDFMAFADPAGRVWERYESTL